MRAMPLLMICLCSLLLTACEQADPDLKTPPKPSDEQAATPADVRLIEIWFHQ